jgi:hypothetical protein
LQDFVEKKVEGFKRMRIGYIDVQGAHERRNYWIVQGCLKESNGSPCTMNRDGVIKPTGRNGVEILVGQKNRYQFFLSQKLKDIIENLNR